MEDKTVTRIVHNVIQCNVCGDIIESEYTHDFKWCSCGNCAVDGGHSYLKRCGDNWTDLSVCEVVTNMEELEKSGSPNTCAPYWLVEMVAKELHRLRTFEED